MLWGKLRKWGVLLFLSPLLLLSLFFFIGSSEEAQAAPEGFGNDMVHWDIAGTAHYGNFSTGQSATNFPAPEKTETPDNAGISRAKLLAATNTVSNGIAPGDGGAVDPEDDDRVWLGYVKDNTAGAPIFYLTRSGDGGQTWAASPVGGFDLDGYFDMAYIPDGDDGKIVMVYDNGGYLYWRYVDSPNTGGFSPPNNLHDTVGNHLTGTKPKLSYDGAKIHVAFISGTSIHYTSFSTDPLGEDNTTYTVIPGTAIASNYPACSITSSNTSIGRGIDIYYNTDTGIAEAHGTNTGTGWSVTTVSGISNIAEAHFPTAVSGMSGTDYMTVLFYSYRLNGETDYKLAYRVKKVTNTLASTWGTVGDIYVRAQKTGEPPGTYWCAYPVNTAASWSPGDIIIRLNHSFGEGCHTWREYLVDAGEASYLKEISEESLYDGTVLRHQGHLVYQESDTPGEYNLQGSQKPVMWGNSGSPPPPVDTWDNVNALTIASVSNLKAYYASVEYNHSEPETYPPFNLNYKRSLWEPPAGGDLADITGSGAAYTFKGDTSLGSGLWGTNGTEWDVLAEKYFNMSAGQTQEDVETWSNLSVGHGVFVRAGTVDYDLHISANDVYDHNWDITGFVPNVYPKTGLPPYEEGMVRGIVAVNPRLEEHYRGTFSGEAPAINYIEDLPEYHNEPFPETYENGEEASGLKATHASGDYNTKFQADDPANKRGVYPGVYRVKLLGFGAGSNHERSPESSWPGIAAKDVFSWMLADGAGPTVNDNGDYGVIGTNIVSSEMPGITREDSYIFGASKSTAGTILSYVENTHFYFWEDNGDPNDPTTQVVYYVKATDPNIFTAGQGGWQNPALGGGGMNTIIGSGISRLEYEIGPDPDPDTWTPNETLYASVSGTNKKFYQNYVFGITRDKFPNAGELYQIRFRVYDNVGNYTEGAEQFIYNTEMPVVTGEVTSPTGEWGWYLDAPVLTVTGDATMCDADLAYFDFVIGVPMPSFGMLWWNELPPALFTADPTQLVDPNNPSLGTGLDTWYASFGISVPKSACTQITPPGASSGGKYSYSFQNGAELEDWLTDPLLNDYVTESGGSIEMFRAMVAITGAEWRGGRAAIYYRGVLENGLPSPWQRLGDPEQPYGALDKPGETTMASYWDWTLRWQPDDPIYNSNMASLCIMGPKWSVPFGSRIHVSQESPATIGAGGIMDWGTFSDFTETVTALPDNSPGEAFVEILADYLPTYWHYDSTENEWEYYSGENGWYRILRPGDYLYDIVGNFDVTTMSGFSTDTGAPGIYNNIYSSGGLAPMELLPRDEWADISILGGGGGGDPFTDVWPYKTYLVGGGAPFINQDYINTSEYHPQLIIYENVSGVSQTIPLTIGNIDLMEYTSNPTSGFRGFVPSDNGVGYIASTSGLDTAHPTDIGIKLPSEGVWSVTWTGKDLAGRVVQSSFTMGSAGTGTFGDDYKTYTGAGDVEGLSDYYDYLIAWGDAQPIDPEMQINWGNYYRAMKDIELGIPYSPTTDYQRLPDLLGYENVLGYDKTPPEISVAPMRYDQNNIELSVTDNLSGYWKLYYSWNGGPYEMTTDNPILLNAPLPGQPNLLTCYAVDMAGNQSGELEFNVPARVTVERIPPDPNVFGWYGQELIWGAGLDKPNVRLTLESGDIEGEEGVFDMPIAAGATTSMGLKDDGTIVIWGSNSYDSGTLPSPNSDFVGVASGAYHHIGLKSDNTVDCWGSNSYGQSTEPAPNEAFKAVAAGERHSLALKTDGSIVAWGDNSYGQCNVPPPNEGFVSMAGGWDFSVGLKADGSLVAWGDNSYGQLDVPSGDVYVAVAAKEHYGLALKKDGTIVSWGGFAPDGIPTENDFIAIAAGDTHAVALKADGSIVSWGDDSSGQVSGTPGGTDFVAITAGDHHSLALKNDGSIVAWGSNYHGQLSVPDGRNFTAISSGPFHNLVLKSDTTTYAWGCSSCGTNPRSNNIGFSKISAGYTHSLGIQADTGHVYGWGVDVSGETGAEFSSCQDVAAGAHFSVAVRTDGSLVSWGNTMYNRQAIPSGNNYSKVAAGYYGGVALKTDGTVAVWGDYSTSPAANSNFVAVDAGGIGSSSQNDVFYVGLKSDGSIYTWGHYNYHPAVINKPSGNDFVAVAAGDKTGYALKSDGSIVAWGDDTYGQVSNVPTGNDFIDITAGGGHAMALKSDGTVVVWGSNLLGEGVEPPLNEGYHIPEGTGFIPARPNSLDHWSFYWDSEAPEESTDNPVLTAPPGTEGGVNVLHFRVYTDSGQEIYGDVEVKWDLISPVPTTSLAIAPNTGWSTWAKDYFLPMFYNTPETGDDVPWLRNETYSMSLTAEDDRSGLWEGGFLLYKMVQGNVTDIVPVNRPTLLVERDLLPGPANPVTPEAGGSLTSATFNPVALGLDDGLYIGKATLFDHAYNTNMDLTDLMDWEDDAAPYDMEFFFVDTVPPQYLGSEVVRGNLDTGTLTIGNIRFDGTWPETFPANFGWCDRAYIQWGTEPGVYPNELPLSFTIDATNRQVWEDIELPNITPETPYFYRFVIYDLAGNQTYSQEDTFEWHPMTNSDEMPLWFEAGGTLMTRLEPCETFGAVPTGVESTLYTNQDTANLDPGGYGSHGEPLDNEGGTGTELAQQGPGVMRQDGSLHKHEGVDYNVSGNVTFITDVFPATEFTDGLGGVIPINRLSIERASSMGGGWASFAGLGIANSVCVAWGENPLPSENGVDITFDLKLVPPADTPVGRYSVRLTFVTYRQ